MTSNSIYPLTLDGRIRNRRCAKCKKERSLSPETKLCSDCERLLEVSKSEDL